MVIGIKKSKFDVGKNEKCDIICSVPKSSNFKIV